MLSALINEAVQAFVSQNQVWSRGMSWAKTERRADAVRDLHGAAHWMFVCCIAVLVAGGLALLMLFSSRAAEAFVLASLALLAMFGAFFLFGLAAGHIRVGHSVDSVTLLRSTIEQLGQGVCITARDGTVVYANEGYRTVVGCSTDGEVRPLEDAFAGEASAAECLFRLMRAADRGEAGQEEFRVRMPEERSRSARWIQLAVQPLKVADGQSDVARFTLWHVADITSDRAREAEALRGAETLLAHYESMPVGFVVADADGTVTHLNATLAGWLKLDLDAVQTGLFTLQTVLSATGEALLQAGIAREPGRPVALELDLVRSDGAVLPALVVGRSGAGGAAGEITAAVLERIVPDDVPGEGSGEASFARLFHAAPFGIATLGRDGKILNANGAFARMFADGGRAGARNLVDLLARSSDEEAKRSIRDSLQQVLAGRTSIEPVEIALGTDRQVTRRIHISPMTQVAKRDEAAVLYVIDATEQKALELKYAQSQKMEAVGKLAGGIAHDFNNVLTAIIGFSDLLLQTHRPTDPAYKDIMNIKQNADRAAGLVRQLLAFSRQQTLLPEVLDLSEQLSDLSIMLTRLIGENIDLRIISARDLWYVKADRSQFDRVIMNLALNARDAMPDGGRLVIRTRNISERDSQKLLNLGGVAGEYVLIEVEDTGHGMSADIMAKIFEPFFSTKDVGKGTGLGLSTVYGIIQQTGGYVLPESEVGKGTTFNIFLPRHVPVHEEPPPTKPPKPDRPRDLTGSGRVLLVEDEDSVRNFAVRALKRQGYEVLEAGSGVEALEVVEREQGRIDIVVSDVVMPEMDGPTLLKHLRQSDPDLKVIFVSGYPDDVFRKSLDPDQQFAFLPKPFTLPQLAAKVKEELGR